MRPMAQFVALAFSLAFQPSQIYGVDFQKEIAAMEQKWAEAVQRNNADEIGEFLQRQFTFVNPRGILLRRAEHLDDFRQKRTVFTKVELSDIVIRVYGDNAVVTSKPKITGFAVTPAGTTTFDAQPARFTDALIRRDGKWQSVARHMSLVSD
jgi:ketosteroid isomerase-like protein